MNEPRFQIIYKQTTQDPNEYIQIIVDTKTGIEYLNIKNKDSGGITPLLKPDTRPVVDYKYIKKNIFKY